MHEPQDAERERRPTDGLTTDRAVVQRVAQHPPAHPDQGEGHQPADLAHGADDSGPHELHETVGQFEPDRGADDHGDPEQEQSGAVTAVLGLQITRGVAEATRTGADAVGDSEPERAERAEQREEDAGYRPGAAPDGARRLPGCGTTRRGPLRRPRLRALGSTLRGGLGLASGLLPGAPCSGARTTSSTATGAAGPCRSRARAPRTRRGRRTGRHGINLGDRHTSHMHHTMRVALPLSDTRS